MQIMPINQSGIRTAAMTLLKLLLLQRATQMRDILGERRGDVDVSAGASDNSIYDEMLEMCIQVRECTLQYIYLYIYIYVCGFLSVRCRRTSWSLNSTRVNKVYIYILYVVIIFDGFVARPFKS